MTGVLASVYVFLFVSCAPIIGAANECISLDVSITQKIENQGFHRDINWLIETQNLDKDAWLEASCNVALRLKIGQELFVNPDQVEDLKRLGKLDIKIEGTVDVEAPAHEATKHIVYIFFSNSQLPNKVHVRLPIHLRYQRSFMGGHSKAHLNRPDILVHCPKSNNIICGKDHKVNAPISSEQFESVKVWRNVTYIGHFEDVDLLVPVGNLNDYPYVSVLTCILGCAGCIYILSLLADP